MAAGVRRERPGPRARPQRALQQARLARAREVVGPVAGGAALGGPLAAAFRILVAEDDALFRDRLALLLEQAGFAVAGKARDGREAVELAAASAPDAVVIDVEMPVLDGVEATRLLRQASPRLPIVAVSGHDYEERVLEIREAGADDYVRKARVEDELPRVLRALLAR